MAKPLSIHTEQREILERILNSHKKVEERLLRATRLLEASGVRYAIVGGNAVAVWVATRDESLVRATRDVDVLIAREDFDQVRSALEGGGFVFRHAGSIDMFLDGADGKAGDALHVLYAGEKVLPDHPTPAPTIIEAEAGPDFQVVSLEALVRMKLNSWRRKDQVHLLDLIGAGLVDATWLDRVPDSLRERLQDLFDNPE